MADTSRIEGDGEDDMAEKEESQKDKLKSTNLKSAQVMESQDNVNMSINTTTEGDPEEDTTERQKSLEENSNLSSLQSSKDLESEDTNIPMVTGEDCAEDDLADKEETQKEKSNLTNLQDDSTLGFEDDEDSDIPMTTSIAKGNQEDDLADKEDTQKEKSKATTLQSDEIIEFEDDELPMITSRTEDDGEDVLAEKEDVQKEKSQEVSLQSDEVIEFEDDEDSNVPMITSRTEGGTEDDSAEKEESQDEKSKDSNLQSNEVMESEDDEDANMPMITVRKDGLFAEEEEEDEQIDDMQDIHSMLHVQLGDEETPEESSSIASRPRRRAAAAAANVIREISQEENIEESRRKSRERSHDQHSMMVGQSGSSDKHRCHVCKKISVCEITGQQFGQDILLCSNACFNTFRNHRRILPCAKCGIIQRDSGFSTYYWETMNFCSDLCIGNFQMEIGSKCATCTKKVAWQSLGKYCVRFGSDVRQFCSASCLESYKKNARVCFHCQLDIKKLSNVILANIPTKATPKEFCSQDCVEMYIEQNLQQTVRTKPNQNSNCYICTNLKPTFRELVLPSSTTKVCCEMCWLKLIEVKKIRNATKCEICAKYVNLDQLIKPAFYVSTHEKVHGFCSATCKNVFVLRNRDILACTSCKVKKYNYDLIQHVSETDTLTFAVCSLNCIPKPSQYIINLRDTLTPASTASEMFTKSRLLQEKQLGAGNVSRIRTTIMPTEADGGLKIASVSSLAQKEAQGPYRFDMASGEDVIEIYEEEDPTSVEITEEEMDKLLDSTESLLIFPMNEPVEKKNKSCLVRPYTTTVGIQVETEELGEKVKEKYIPILIPYYVPFPFYGFDSPAPIPLPIPLPIPIPIPILLPATPSTSSDSSSKSTIPQIVNDMPCNLPLPMDQQQQQQGQNSLRGSTETESLVEIPENMRLDSVEFLDLTGPNVGEADNFDYLSTIPSLDMELNLGAVSSSHGLHAPHSLMHPGPGMMSTGGMGHPDNISMMQSVVNTMDNPNVNPLQQWQQQSHVMAPSIPIAPIPKLTRENYAIRAWNQYFGHDFDPWINGEVLAGKLVEWVEKGRKPNGDRYKPSFLLYLCLGIQEYLRHNQRSDKIFYDPVYEPFVRAFTDYAANSTHQMNGTVESPIDDYHLWESSELGVSSPQVLVFTLIYLNYKYFHLQSWQDHSALRFEQIMVVEKIISGRKVKYLVIQGLSSKYDVAELHLSPTKCPIKLFEFYKHKCLSPTGNFYKAIIPHCPKAAWFSADALDEMQIYRMLMRAILISHKVC